MSTSTAFASMDRAALYNEFLKVRRELEEKDIENEKWKLRAQLLGDDEMDWE